MEAPQTRDGEMKATQEHLEFLDDLRESGATNMFGAVPYLRREFPELSLHDTAEVMVEYLCIVAPPFAFTFLDTREPTGLHEPYHHSRKRS